MRANQIMTPQVITVGAETTIIEAIHLMLQHHIGGLPVLDATGALIGIVSQGDFIRRAEIGTQHKRGRWLSFLAGPDRRATDFARVGTAPARSTTDRRGTTNLPGADTRSI